MNFVAILPSIWPEWTNLCLDSMSSRLAAFTIVVDNTVENRGVPASWNIGARYTLETDAEWCVIISAAVRFGEPGGLDFLAALDHAEGGEWAIEAGECANDPTIGLGWHLIGFRRSTFERVGLFDENFFPGYFEDLDFGHRIRCATPSWQEGPDPLWPKVNVDADLAGFAHGKRLAGVDVPIDPLVRYFSRKWGGLVGQTMYDRPFGDPKNDLGYWPEPDRGTGS